VPVHLSSPVARSRPRTRHRFRGCLPRRAHVKQIHEEIIGERLWPLREDAVLDPPKLVFKTRMPPTSTVISGAVRVSNCALSTSNASADTVYWPLSSCGSRPRSAQARRRRPHRSWPARHPCVRREGNRHLVTSILRSLLDARATGQDDQVSQRYLLAAGLRPVERALDALQA